MKVTYIYHSCYLVELEHHALLFDYFEGELPKINKPLYVFASHFHQDHFNKKIFDLNAKEYILSKDIRKRRKKQIIKDATFVVHDEEYEIDDVKIHTLNSTDCGVAFIVQVEGKTIYHAGDLNNWYWEGEKDSFNHQQETNYKKYLEPLKQYTIDIGFVVLDPRLENAYDLGMTYFLENISCKHVFPMHMWKQYEYCDKFLKEHPNNPFICIHKENEEFIL